MPRTAAQRIAQYNARMDAQLVGAAYSAVNALAKQNFATYANYFVPLQQATQAQLGAEGVPASQLFGYYAFTQEMLRVWPRYMGTTRDLEVCILIMKYTALGLTQSVLESLVVNVWGSPAYPTCFPGGCGDAEFAISPAAGATAQPVDGTLSWLLDTRAESVDVYLDTVNPPVTKVVDALRVLSYDYTGLAAATPHYWRVDISYPAWGTPATSCVVTGTVHTFTTA